MSYSHILVATDLGTSSGRIIQKSQELASLFSAKLSIIHVISPLHEYRYSSVGEVEDEMINQAKQKIFSFMKENNIFVENVRVELGLVKSELLRAAKETDADLIIIGGPEKIKLNSLLRPFFSCFEKVLTKATNSDVFVLH